MNTIRYRMKLVNAERERIANKDKGGTRDVDNIVGGYQPGEKRVHIKKPFWTEIVRRMSSQKAITTEAVNALGEKVKIKMCSTPRKEAADIYEMLGYKKMPFWRKLKVCSTQ